MHLATPTPRVSTELAIMSEEASVVGDAEGSVAASSEEKVEGEVDPDVGEGEENKQRTVFSVESAFIVYMYIHVLYSSFLVTC